MQNSSKSHSKSDPFELKFISVRTNSDFIEILQHSLFRIITQIEPAKFSELSGESYVSSQWHNTTLWNYQGHNINFPLVVRTKKKFLKPIETHAFSRQISSQTLSLLAIPFEVPDVRKNFERTAHFSQLVFPFLLVKCVNSQVWYRSNLAANFGLFELRTIPWSLSKVQVNKFYPFTLYSK